MGQTKITILCENSVNGLFGITGEHGFAALIEKDGKNLIKKLKLSGNVAQIIADSLNV